ncbi:MAG: sigma-54-dependent Fis family transcriptional regulator [Verrucomicrobia bacterium]|jgi:DNA-binding NtrC family response regulator|nr:sigma-54-dependent Fis family transcriptional regulator [Verrucomicrobiota bacterium]MBT7067938.1 sigma-54-dependent Fis family transcriptional regulator [Verrucomicrobiota bacterium]MBT7700593.1 sigma-54-dependent Fis family transcriptional regulator [Verrucomicrobiota bacterium]
MNTPRILIVEDDPDGRASVLEAVQDAGMQATAAASGKEGIAIFKEDAFDVVLSDLVLPDIDGVEVLISIGKLQADVPVMIMTAYGSVDSSVRAMKAGAYDYITKPLDLDDLQTKLKRAVETSRLRQQVDSFRSAARTQFGARAITAEDPKSTALLEQIKTLAATNATVLIQGESGTGKELIAHALHYDGLRCDGPFVAVNCGAFTESLLASELFGHEKGAFTGAIRKHKGAFERADGGTLFLDEIGDAPLDVQIKLLRVLEERRVTRIGGQESFGIDTRVISASNRILNELVADGAFREDLLYRLKVVDITVPPLRERRGDIRPLADRFIAAACSEHGRHIDEVTADFHDALVNCNWPGNIRQLRNVIESAVVMSTSSVLTSASLALPHSTIDSRIPFVTPTGMPLEDIEREILRQALARNQGNRTLTAEELKISRRTIQRKIKEHNLPF